MMAEFLDNNGANYFLLDMPVNNEMGLSYDVMNLGGSNGFPISWQQESPYKAFRIATSWNSDANGSINWWDNYIPTLNTHHNERCKYECNFKNSRKIIIKSESETKETQFKAFTCNYDKVSFGKLLKYNGTSVSTHDWAKIKMYSIKLSSGESLVYDLAPVIDANGKPCLYDKVSKQAYYGKTANAFIVGMTTAQARKLSKLAAGGGTLTVSLPWEAGVDAKVQDALAKAAAHGWTVVVQYREPEVTTENIAVDFLEGTGTQWLRTDSVTNGRTVFSAKIAPMKYISNAPSFFGARESYPKKMFCVCLNEKKLVFRYDSKQIVISGMLEIGKAYEVEYTDEIFRVNDEEKVLSRASFENPNPLGIFQTITENGAGTDGILSARLFYLHLTTEDALGEVHAYNYVPALNANGKPCLYDKERGKNFYNAGSGSFIAGFESTEKAALGLAKLPVVEAGKLTVSLPAAAQEEATRVPAAIEVARQRGWTILTQYRED